MLKSIFKIVNSFISLLQNKWRLFKIRQILNNVKREELIKKNIVINIVRSIQSFESELIIGKLLALKGAKVKVLIDDGILRHWEAMDFDHIKNLNNIKKTNLNPYRYDYRDRFIIILTFFNRLNVKSTINAFKDENLEIIYYSDIIKDRKLDYSNIKNLKKDALSSVVRFFRRPDLDLKDKIVKYYYLISYQNALISKNIGIFIENKLKTDIFMTSHGIYSLWAPTYDYLKSKNIKTLVYHGKSHSIEQDDLLFSDIQMQLLSKSKLWNQYKNKPIQPQMKEFINEYLRRRTNFSTTDTELIYKGKHKTFQILKDLDYKYHIALFPNVVWDGYIVERHNIFDGHLEWLISTLDYLKNRKDILIYLKLHPAELIFCDKSPGVLHYLEKNLNLSEFKNLVILSADQKINTYDFLRSGLDLGIVYDTFIAIEMPYFNIPAIVCVNGGMTSVEGVNYTINSKEEYFNLLDNIDIIINDFKKKHEIYYNNMIRFVFWHIKECGNKVPPFFISLKKKYQTNKKYVIDIRNLIKMITEQ